MLEIQNLTLTLKRDGRVLVRDFSFVLGPQDKAAIIGEEGNGKSTLLQAVACPQRVEPYCEVEGRIFTGGSRLGYLEQELPEEARKMPVRDYLQGVDIYEDGLQWELGLDPDWIQSSRPLGSLSGGEKVKIRLARLLSKKPDVLLLDEPTNDLDVETLGWLEDFIRRWPLPVLYISHDETLLERTATVILHLEQVRRKTVPRATVARLGYAEYAERRRLGLAKQEQVARKQQAEHRAQMERWQQIYNRVDHEQRVISRQDPGGGRLLKKKMKSVKAQEKRLEKEAASFEEIPDVEEAIDCRFAPAILLPRGKTVLDLAVPELRAGGRLLASCVCLRMTGPQHVAILGENGTGKTTLLRLAWEALRDRTDIKAGYMPQQYGDVLPETATPAEFLAPGGDKERTTKARRYLGSLRFTPEEMERRIGDLSGGQKAKLLLAGLLLDECDVLVLDEPTRNLSPLSCPVIRRALADYRGAILSVTHDRKYMREVCDTWLRLTPGGLVPEDRGLWKDATSGWPGPLQKW